MHVRTSAQAHIHKTMQVPMCAYVLMSHSYAHALACTLHVPYSTHNINNRTLYMYSYISCTHVHTHIHNMGLGDTVDNTLSIVFSLI